MSKRLLSWTICVLTIGSISNTTYSAPEQSIENCGRQIPQFWDELYDRYMVPQDGRLVMVVGVGMTLLNVVLEKPVNPDLETRDKWLRGYRVDRVCIYGDQNKREIDIRANAIVIIDSEHSNTDKTQVLALDLRFRFDVDRLTYEFAKSDIKHIDITGGFGNFQSYEDLQLEQD